MKTSTSFSLFNLLPVLLLNTCVGLVFSKHSWPCLHQWLETKPNRQVCPVCKAAISRDKVIPLYGRGSAREDPRNKLPPRPAGQRTEPEHYSSANFPGFGFGDGGIHMSFGIGAFPFGFFASSFNFNDGRAHMSKLSSLFWCNNWWSVITQRLSPFFRLGSND